MLRIEYEANQLDARRPKPVTCSNRRHRHMDRCVSREANRINTATYYALILGIAIDWNWRTGVLVMAVFAIARALPACSLSVLSFGGATAFLAPAINIEEIMHLMNAVILIGCGVRLLCPWI